MTEIERIVYEAIGAASMCWDPTPTGVFEATKAKSVAEKLVGQINAMTEKEKNDTAILTTKEVQEIFDRCFDIDHAVIDVDVPHSVKSKVFSLVSSIRNVIMYRQIKDSPRKPKPTLLSDFKEATAKMLAEPTFQFPTPEEMEEAKRLVRQLDKDKESERQVGETWSNYYLRVGIRMPEIYSDGLNPVDTTEDDLTSLLGKPLGALVYRDHQRKWHLFSVKNHDTPHGVIGKTFAPNIYEADKKAAMSAMSVGSSTVAKKRVTMFMGVDVSNDECDEPTIFLKSDSDSSQTKKEGE